MLRYATLPDYSKQWLKLYEAVSNRDAEKMHAISIALMEEGISNERYAYLTEAAMIGHLVLEQPHEAVQVWKTAIKPADNPFMKRHYFRLLALFAEAEMIKSSTPL